MNENNVQFYQLLAAGGTLTLDASLHKDIICIWSSGTVTLTSNFTIASTNDTEATTYKIFWFANYVQGANTVTILGTTFTNLSNTLITATKDLSGTWHVSAALPNQAGSVSATNLAGGILLSQLAQLTAGKIVATDASGNVVAVTVGSGYLVTYNGTQIVAVAISGDVTMSNSGATTLNSRFKIGTLAVPVSWETGESGTTIIFSPYSSGITITQIYAVVTKTITGTSATIALSTPYGSIVTNTPITITAQAQGQGGVSVTVVSGGTSSGSLSIQVTPSSGLTAGRVMLYLIFTIN